MTERDEDRGPYATMIVDDDGVRVEITATGEVIQMAEVEECMAMCDRGETPPAEMRARVDRVLLAFALEVTGAR
jgi:hypothetical protein